MTVPVRLVKTAADDVAALFIDISVGLSSSRGLLYRMKNRMKFLRTRILGQGALLPKTSRRIVSTSGTAMADLWQDFFFSRYLYLDNDQRKQKISVGPTYPRYFLIISSWLSLVDLRGSFFEGAASASVCCPGSKPVASAAGTACAISASSRSIAAATSGGAKQLDLMVREGVEVAARPDEAEATLYHLGEVVRGGYGRARPRRVWLAVKPASWPGSADATFRAPMVDGALGCVEGVVGGRRVRARSARGTREPDAELCRSQVQVSFVYIWSWPARQSVIKHYHSKESSEEAVPSRPIVQDRQKKLKLQLLHSTTATAITNMAFRGTESPMDFEWQGHGPIDPTSPFHKHMLDMQAKKRGRLNPTVLLLVLMML